MGRGGGGRGSARRCWWRRRGRCRWHCSRRSRQFGADRPEPAAGDADGDRRRGERATAAEPVGVREREAGGVSSEDNKSCGPAGTGACAGERSLRDLYWASRGLHPMVAPSASGAWVRGVGMGLGRGGWRGGFGEGFRCVVELVDIGEGIETQPFGDDDDAGRAVTRGGRRGRGRPRPRCGRFRVASSTKGRLRLCEANQGG